MKNGDLSNQTSPRVLIDFDLLISGERQLNMLEKTKLILTGKDLQKYEYNIYNVHYLYGLIRHTNVSITLVTTNPRFLKGYNEDPILPCNLKYVSCKDTLNYLIDTGHMYDYFVTNDANINLEDIPRYIRILSFSDFVQKFGVRK